MIIKYDVSLRDETSTTRNRMTLIDELAPH